MYLKTELILDRPSGQFLVVIEMEKGMREHIADLDGWKLPMGKEMFDLFILTVKRDGKFLGKSYNRPYPLPTEGLFVNEEALPKGAYSEIVQDVYAPKDMYDLISGKIDEMEKQILANEPDYLQALADKKTADRARQAAEDIRNDALMKIVVPAEAVAAYRRYDGSPDKAWESEDELASMLTKKYALAIEMQNLCPEASSKKFNAYWKQLYQENHVDD